ncbi:unnamed protein product [Rotaria magnacalcarata]|uniref:Band 7 domain-containing protein n=2 Tax=Rotaria magnacalcarata TaxID=392030 RepID=A0A816UTR9_9BILA|nr:unnamed protein product [Rotaria magnacalcarata]CAF2113041.1 unnamed protein product [Rotaria magnacalcarata]CAF3756275.1 unnamed protein product [Rotaria magnacalcarata]CAF4127311.1 unnamed protein product [Rotaria magnacalcarata]
MGNNDGNVLRWIWLAVTAGIIGVLLLVILLPISFSYLDYYHYGFLRRHTTGRVNLDRVYEGGRYLVGPDYHFKKFKATAHHVNFNRISVFTTDNLEVHLTITFQFFLIRDDLPLLHAAYDIYYEPIIVSNAKEAIISTCSRFDTDEFINDREKIWREIYYGVKRQLGGSCCIPNCKRNCPKCSIHERCVNGCKSREEGCKKEEKGFFAEVRYLQLHDIDVPDRVMERRLLGLVRDLEKEREEYINQEALVKKQTDILVNQFRNNATQSVAISDAQAQLKRERAKSDALKRVEISRIDGLALMCSTLGITQAKHINSLQYLRTLRESSDNIKYSIDFSHAIAQQQQQQQQPKLPASST